LPPYTYTRAHVHPNALPLLTMEEPRPRTTVSPDASLCAALIMGGRADQPVDRD